MAPAVVTVVTVVVTVNFYVVTVATAQLKSLKESCLLGRYGHYVKIDNHYNGHHNGKHGH